MDKRIRVLIVDDSSLMRAAIKSILSSDTEIEVVGEACNGKEGVEKTRILKPNVITMDLKMPIMGGLEAIDEIMQNFPTPIITVSTLDKEVIVKALVVGAMDFVPVTQDIDTISEDLIEKVKIAAKVRPLKRMKIKLPGIKKEAKKKDVSKVVAIGVSTGGPQALQLLLSKLPHDFPAGILIVQHISEGFIDGLAEWLRDTSSLDIKVAKARDNLKTSTAFLAPDSYNIGVDEDGAIMLSEDTSKSTPHIPSIDIMMKSIAQSYGKDAVGVIMTGMGRDGVEGIWSIKDAGGITIAQDEETSMIFGMNKAAIDRDCVDKIVPLEKLADEIVRAVKQGDKDA